MSQQAAFRLIDIFMPQSVCNAQQIALQYEFPPTKWCIKPGFGSWRQYTVRDASTTTAFLMRLSVALPTVSQTHNSLITA